MTMRLHFEIISKNPIEKLYLYGIKKIAAISTLVVIALLAVSCSRKTKTDSLNIALAANMQFAMDSIADVYEQKEGVELVLSSNSSGMLANQIMEGAPFDVFLSANKSYADKLIEGGFAKSAEIYAHGRLVLVYESLDSLTSVDQVLKSNEIQRIGVANKITAPYGIASNELLSHLNSEEINSKVIYGESVGQVNQYITTGAVDASLTSNSFITKFKDDYNYLMIDSNDYTPISQTACSLTHGLEEKSILVSNFVAFLDSDECKEILTYFGYIVD